MKFQEIEIYQRMVLISFLRCFKIFQKYFCIVKKDHFKIKKLERLFSNEKCKKIKKKV